MAKTTSVTNTEAPLELATDSDGVVTTATPVAPPTLNIPEGPDPIERHVRSQRRGATVPTITESALAETGQLTGFSGGIGKGFDEGVLGYLFNNPANQSQEEDFMLTESAEAYARENPWSNFAAEMIGRTASDSPIDLVVSGGMTLAGKFLVKAGRAASVATKSVDKMEDSVNGLTKLLATPEYDLGKADIFKRQLIEGMFTGAISEMALQNLGKAGGSKDVLESMVMDAMGGAVFGTGLKALGELTGFSPKKLAKETSDAIEETTGLRIAENKFIGPLEQHVKREGVDTPVEIPKRPIEPGPRKTVDEIADIEAPKAEVLSSNKRKVETQVDNIQKGKAFDATRSIPEGVAVRNMDEFDGLMDKMVEANPKDMQGMKGLMRNLIEARAKATGHRSADDWLGRQNLRAGEGAAPKVLFGQTHTLLTAPYKATSFREFVHEIGHILEFDLDNKTLGTIAKEYGGSGKDVFSRDTSERFAQDFEKYVSELASGREPTTFPDKLKDAFNRILTYMKGIFTGLPIDPVDPKMRAIFDDIFATPRDLRRGGDFRANRAIFKAERGGSELHFTPEEPNKLLDRQEKTLEELNDHIKSAEAERSEAPLAKTSGIGKLLNSFIQKAPKFMGTGVLTAQSLFSGLGATGAKIWKKLEDGILKESVALARNTDIMRKAMDDHKFTEKDSLALAETHDVTFTLKDGTTITRNITGHEILHMHLTARDSVSKYGGRRSLKEKGYMFEGEDVETALTEQQVREIGKGTWLQKHAGDGAVRGAGAMRQTLDEIGAIQKEIIRERMGDAEADLFELDRHYYMKAAIKAKKKITQFDINKDNLKTELGKMTANSKIIYANIFKATSANYKRTGLAPIRYQNPFEALVKHSDQQARLEGLGEEVAFAQAWLNKMAPEIEDNMGPNTLSSLQDIMASTAGGRSGDPIAGKISSKIFKGQVLSALSWNLSPIMKQIPSLVTGLQKMGLPVTDGGKYFAEAGGKDLHDEVMKVSPTYQMRYRSAGQSADLYDIGISDAFHNRAFDGVKFTDAMKNKGALGKVEAAAQAGMGGIRAADARTIRGLYLASKDKLGLAEKKVDDMTPEEIGSIEKLLHETIIATQPTYHPLTRSSSQNSDNFLTRQFAMFSSQPMKNFNLFIQDIQKLSTLTPGSPEFKKAQEDLRGTLGTLALQASLVSAAGAVSLSAKDAVLDSMRSDEANKEREKYYQDMGKEWQRVWSQSLATSFGNVPVSGQFISGILQEIITGNSFDAEVLPLRMYNDFRDIVGDISEGLAEGDVDLTSAVEDLATTFAPLAAIPSVAVQGAKAARD